MSRDERGSVTPLIIGFTLILLVLVAVVTDASAAFLRRQEMDSLADASALAATDGLQGDQVYTRGLDHEQAEIDPVAAQRYVQDYLARSGARSAYPGLDVRVVTDTNVVRVRLSAPLVLPFHVPHAGPSTTVTGDAASEVLIGR
ncbi:hypothetical protein D9V37_08130 [Nocardioides mangrovicus]|uniref:Putative Flp pilus-assembly TadG-like N-terminal domain-containing protein n=1 Tax=Nocardioides mangrovicus TaxID=2478913 RepID=A0A3L8P3K4_9ACTN|nr:pilus assembly protein TadG-related protein [Nocardioides mangrovicus]RLV49845.1 hypothetical protein D9V37_08130 [Nocardioides mangrovicus]